MQAFAALQLQLYQKQEFGVLQLYQKQEFGVLQLHQKQEFGVLQLHLLFRTRGLHAQEIDNLHAAA